MPTLRQHGLGARIILTSPGTAQRPVAAAGPACPAPPATYPTKTTRLDFRRAFNETRVSTTTGHYRSARASGTDAPPPA
jgi:hypothetical protein